MVCEIDCGRVVHGDVVDGDIGSISEYHVYAYAFPARQNTDVETASVERVVARDVIAERLRKYVAVGDIFASRICNEVIQVLSYLAHNLTGSGFIDWRRKDHFYYHILSFLLYVNTTKLTIPSALHSVSFLRLIQHAQCLE
jgi:hypothetical protein